MFSQIKLILLGITVLGAMGGLMYVKHLQSENEILKLNNEKLEGAINEQQKVIEQQLKDMVTKQEDLMKYIDNLNKKIPKL